MKNHPLLLAVILSAVALAACAKKQELPTPITSQPASPAVPGVDPSLPAAPATPPPMSTQPDPAQTSRDTSATNPSSDLSRKDESTAMPQAGHGNNHSSPSLEPSKSSDGATNK